jgi:hypothetical protein
MDDRVTEERPGLLSRLLRWEEANEWRLEVRLRRRSLRLSPELLALLAALATIAFLAGVALFAFGSLPTLGPDVRPSRAHYAESSR